MVPVLLTLVFVFFFEHKTLYSNRFQVIICAKCSMAWSVGLCAQTDKITLRVIG